MARRMLLHTADPNEYPRPTQSIFPSFTDSPRSRLEVEPTDRTVALGKTPTKENEEKPLESGDDNNSSGSSNGYPSDNKKNERTAGAGSAKTPQAPKAPATLMIMGEGTVCTYHPKYCANPIKGYPDEQLIGLTHTEGSPDFKFFVRELKTASQKLLMERNFMSIPKNNSRAPSVMRIDLENGTYEIDFHFPEDKEAFAKMARMMLLHTADPNEYQRPTPTLFPSFKDSPFVPPNYIQFRIIDEAEEIKKSTTRSPLVREKARSEGDKRSMEVEKRHGPFQLPPAHLLTNEDARLQQQRKELPFVPPDLKPNNNINNLMWEFVEKRAERDKKSLWMDSDMWEDFLKTRPTQDISSAYLLMAHLHAKMADTVWDDDVKLHYKTKLRIAADLAVKVPREMKDALENQFNIKITLSTYGYLNEWKEFPNGRSRKRKLSSRKATSEEDESDYSDSKPGLSNRRSSRAPTTTKRLKNEYAPKERRSAPPYGSRSKSFIHTDDSIAWQFKMDSVEQAGSRDRVKPASENFWEKFVEEKGTTRTIYGWRERFRTKMYPVMHKLEYPKDTLLKAFRMIGRRMSREVTDYLEQKFNVEIMFYLRTWKMITWCDNSPLENTGVDTQRANGNEETMRMSDGEDEEEMIDDKKRTSDEESGGDGSGESDLDSTPRRKVVGSDSK